MARSSKRKQKQHDRRHTLLFALGAAGGLALGLLLTRPSAREPVRRAGARLRERARDVALTLGPGRLRRPEREQRRLTRLEDAVLDAFLREPVLGQRGIDVGCISPGIIELSGSVRTADEAALAVRVARAVDGVETVVQRMDVEEPGRRVRRPVDPAATEGRMAGEWTGRNVGMGQRRQGPETEKRGGVDDSQHMREMALEQSDRDQYEDEGLAHSHPVMSERAGPAGPINRTRFEEHELDNQDPYRDATFGEPAQELNSQARVGEGLPPGMELALEAEDVPVKPHSGARPGVGDQNGRPER